ncbi:hypothetical protein L7F22_034147 [Adiantum nelumboides]|nr:hypothetical protein [Adiantum nelumboides]
MAFMQRFGARETFEKLWERLCELALVNVSEYGEYELQFTNLWDKWVATLAIGERAPDFLKRDRFVAGLCPPLEDKVKARFPVTFEAAREVARLKERKLRYQLQHREVDQEENGGARPPPGNVAPPHRGSRVVDQQDLLNRITSQLEDLSVHLIKAPALPEQGRGQRRQSQDYHYNNCGEEGHQMYFCPHPRRNANYRGPRQQVSPPRGRQQQLYQPPIPMQQAPPVQILRPLQQQQPLPPPAPIPPLSPVPKNRAVSIISLDTKGKAKVEEEEVSLPKGKGKGKGKEKKQEEVDAMPIKRARQEEIADSEADTRRKTKESAESSKKKKTKPRQKLTIKDFSLGESSQPYDLVDDVSMQGPKISWPQLLYLSLKVRRQWSKMVSTRRVKTKAMGLVSGRSLKDIVSVVDAYVKGQHISNVYVDGGAQICVMSEHVFHRLGLKISAPAPYKAKMANNVKVKCLGIVNGVRVKVCEVEVEVDVYVMPTKGESYPIILRRPWFMAMQARQDWGIGMPELSPHKGSGKKAKVVRYDMKIGKQGKMKFETSADEFSSSTCSTTIEEESTTSDESDSSGEEVMGLILTEPNKVDPPLPRVEGSKLAKMLAKDLTKEEKQAYLTMLEDFPRLFIKGYDQITGVTVVQHHIKLKEGSKPTVQRLQRLGVIQQDALLAEVRKLLNAGFIYPVEDSEWVSPVVVTPKKNGKWQVCVDYKPLNAATKRDHFPLPFQDKILNEVAGYERYTVKSCNYKPELKD